MSRVPRTVEAVAELVAVSLVAYAVVVGRVDATLGVCVVAAVLAGSAAVRAVVGRVAPDASPPPDAPPPDSAHLDARSSDPRSTDARSTDSGSFDTRSTDARSADETARRPGSSSVGSRTDTDSPFAVDSESVDEERSR